MSQAETCCERTNAVAVRLFGELEGWRAARHKGGRNEMIDRRVYGRARCEGAVEQETDKQDSDGDTGAPDPGGGNSSGNTQDQMTSRQARNKLTNGQ